MPSLSKAVLTLLLPTTALSAGIRLPRDVQDKNEDDNNRKSGPMVFERRPVTPNMVDVDNNHERRLLNGGSFFLVSKQMNNGVEWCMDAVNGVVPNERRDGQFPSLGLRPCAFNSGPTEQLFNADQYNFGGLTNIDSNFPGPNWDTDFCLVVEDGEKTSRDGDRVRIGSCPYDPNRPGNFFVVEDQFSVYTQIKVGTHRNLCLTYEGQNPDDDDNIIVRSCENTDKFFFEFRTGWYILGSSGNCVQVRDGRLESGNRVVFDRCDSHGFGEHWRMDGLGRLRSRMNDSYCMQAEQRRAGAAIRIRRCSDNALQKFFWPNGFEGSINLVGSKDLFLNPQGQNFDAGDIMVLSKIPGGWSGDSVHV